MPIRRGALGFVAVAALVFGACGDDDAAEPGTRIEEAGDDTVPGDEASPDSDLPDPCAIFSEDELTEAFGDPGAGTPGSVDPSRRVCSYSSGTIVGVATPEQYEGTLLAADAAGSVCTEVPAVGEQASFCTSFDRVGQLLWVAGDAAYDVTALSTDQATFIGLAALVE